MAAASTAEAVPSHRSHKMPASPVSTSVSIRPEYLVFPPPHQGRAIQNVIYVLNTADTACVYKLQTQYPNRYVAKPNVAVIAPRSATRVKVTLCVTEVDGSLPPDTRERFRISVKMLPEAPSATLPPKEVWSRSQEPILLQRDLVAYFSADVPTPIGGMVSFFPAKYIAAHGRARKGSTNPTTGEPQAPQQQQQHADPMSALRTDEAGSPPPGGAHDDASGESPRASRQLGPDLDKAAREGAVTATSPALKRRRTWKTFLQATLAAIGLAYSIGLLCRLWSVGETSSASAKVATAADREEGG